MFEKYRTQYSMTIMGMRSVDYEEAIKITEVIFFFFTNVVISE